MFNNSTVLITGGTGSFGHTFMPMLLNSYNPKKVIVFSRDEMKQWEMAKLYGDDPRVRFYNQRGTAEQHIKEGKYAFHWTRLSCKRFRDNEVRLQLHALAYNLATFLRCIDLPEAMANWSLTSLQLKLIKMGARVVRHARAITFQLAEVAVTGPMVRAILTAIHRLRAPPMCA